MRFGFQKKKTRIIFIADGAPAGRKVEILKVPSAADLYRLKFWKCDKIGSVSHVLDLKRVDSLTVKAQAL